MNRKWLGRLLLAILRVIPKKYPVASSSIAIPEPFFIISSGRSGSTLLNRLLNQHSQLFLPSEQYFIHNLIIKFQLYNWILWRDLGKILAGEIVNSLGAHTWDWDFEETYSKIVLAKGEERTLKWLIDHIIRNYASQMGSEPTLWGDTTPLNSRYIQEIYSVYPEAKYIYLVRDPRDVVSSFKRRENAPNHEFTDHVKCAKKLGFCVWSFSMVGETYPSDDGTI